MGFWGRLFQRKSSTLSPWTARGGWSPAIAELHTSTAGEVVTADSAMTLGAVHGCVRILSESIASMPLITYRRTADGARDRATDHWLYPLLHDAPADGWTALEFWEQAVWALALRGNFYAFINRTADGKVLELLPIPPDRVRVEAGTGGAIRYHVTRPTGGTVEYPKSNMLHIRLVTLDGLTGLSPIGYAREVIGAGLAAQRHTGDFFNNALRPGGLLTHPGTLSETATRNIQASLEDRHAGPGNGWKFMLLQEGVTWTPLGMNHADAQFLELRKFSRAEIASLFRVPLHMLNDLERATFSNVEAMGQEFVTYTLRPWLRRIEQAIARDLIPRAERGRIFCEFLTHDLLKADTLKRFQAYEVAIRSRIMSPNEARKAENMAPYEGGDEFANPQPGGAGPAARIEGEPNE